MAKAKKKKGPSCWKGYTAVGQKRKKDLVVGKVIQLWVKRNHLVVRKLKVVEVRW